jgi:hypothetical protein
MLSELQGARMDERIEAFLLDLLEDEGKNSDIVGENTRRYLATYEEMFRAEEVQDHKKDEAAQRCRDWCRQRVLEEIDQREGTPTADHLRIVLNAIEQPAPI